MGYKIEDIEGIGPAYGAKLAAVGLKSTDAFLKHGRDRKGRKKIAADTGISEALILKWTNHADLMRITGIGPEFSELLEAAGVDTVKELRNRNAENLTAKMKTVNAEKKLTRATPALSRVTDWIGQAQKLTPMVSH